MAHCHVRGGRTRIHTSDALLRSDTLDRRTEKSSHQRHMRIAVVSHVEVCALVIRVKHADLDHKFPLILLQLPEAGLDSQADARVNRNFRYQLRFQERKKPVPDNSVYQAISHSGSGAGHFRIARDSGDESSPIPGTLGVATMILSQRIYLLNCVSHSAK